MTPIGYGLGAPQVQLGLGVSAPGRAAGNGLLNNLISYWKLDEASGNALDAHTNALHLADQNTVMSAAGKVYSTARLITLANVEALYRGDSALLSVGDVDFTLAAWIKLTTSNSTMHIIGKDNEASGGREYRLNFLIATRRLSFRVFDGTSQVGIAQADALGEPQNGTWYFVVCYHDSVSNKVGIQINGGTVNTGDTTAGPADTATPFTIGAANIYNSPYGGLVGPACLWKSAPNGGGVLTAAQRTALYANGNGLAYASFTA
jgi:hypothetical protein